MEQKKSKKGLIALIVAIVVVVALLVAYHVFKAQPSAGAKAVTVTVVDASGDATEYETNTDAEYLSEVMDELSESTDFSYDGYDSDYGLYITAVNSITADYDTDGAYWSIYVNGEYGMYGADSQPVTDGDEYTFAYEVYAE